MSATRATATVLVWTCSQFFVLGRPWYYRLYSLTGKTV